VITHIIVRNLKIVNENFVNIAKCKETVKNTQVISDNFVDLDNNQMVDFGILHDIIHFALVITVNKKS